MEKIFRKITTVFLSVLFMSIMLVTAGVYPVPFIDNNEANVAVIYGAAGVDSAAADSLVNSLADKIVTIEELERIMSAGISEDEVKLGSNLDDEIRNVLTDNKIPSLFDGKISWDDGEDTNRYNVHEEIIIGNLRIETSLDNNDLREVALTNDKGLEYKYIFEEDIFGDRNLGSTDAEALEITILGEDYLIEDVEEDSITVTNAKKIILSEGASTTVEGKTLTIDNIYEYGVFINDVYVEEGKRKSINGIWVRVETVYYRDSSTASSKVEISVGGEISKDYSDGDAFIGEDKDDPEWVWSISDPGMKNGWIGVRYDLRQIDEDDDVVYEGEQYVFPNNFTTVSFDSLTDVDYYDYDIFFDDIDLYNNSDNDKNDELYNSADVVIIKGTEDNSFELGGDYETDTIYLRKSGSDIEVYYMDLAEDFSTGKPVYYTTINSTTTYSGDDCDNNTFVNAIDFGLNGQEFTNITGTYNCSVDSETTISETSIAILIADDTEFNITVSMNNIGVTTLSIKDIEISLGDTTAFTQLGTEDEDAENDDVIVNGNSIGTDDNDVMDYYGTIIESPDSNADDDKVVLKIPSERVYVQISVLGSEENLETPVVVKPTAAELGITKIADNNVATASGKNLIVVGGSCINTLAAELLGGKYCVEEFTAKTGVSAGQVLIQTFERNGNLVTLVAGYHVADTTRGVAKLLEGNINIAVGERVII